MRDWRNRQTRTFKGRVGDRVSSSLTSRTKGRIRAHLAPFFHTSTAVTYIFVRSFASVIESPQSVPFSALWTIIPLFMFIHKMPKALM